AAFPEKQLVALVRPLRRPETRVLAKRPQAIPVPTGVIAASKRKLPGLSDAAVMIGTEVPGSVAPLYREPGFGGQFGVTLGRRGVAHHLLRSAPGILRATVSQPHHQGPAGPVGAAPAPIRRLDILGQ